uniref:SAP domain-containing ribonucleoprotein isoform X1 n=1 Tax=Myxine glutinosa TaxID=7769 RepID=UPI00358E5FBC
MLVMADEVVDVHKLKIAELKQELVARGLETKGNKAELVRRLQTYIEEHDNEVNEEDALAEEPDVRSDYHVISPSPLAEDKEVETAALPTKDAEEEAEVPQQSVKVTTEMSQAERMIKRAERFNVPVTEASKKTARAQRFGMPATNTLGGDQLGKEDMGKLQERAKRFGMNVSTVAQKLEVEDKLKKRKERFGVVTTACSGDGEAKRLKRAQRFGIV